VLGFSAIFFWLWFLTYGKDISKVFIASPEPLVGAFSKGVTQKRRLKDVLSLTSTLADEKLRHNV